MIHLYFPTYYGWISILMLCLNILWGLVILYIVVHIYRVIKLLPFVEDPKPIKKVRAILEEAVEEVIPVKK